MKKVILTLFVSLSCVMLANAGWNLCIEDTLVKRTGNDSPEARYFKRHEAPVVDTLPKRVVNGLEVTPIRTTYESGGISWKLRASDFTKCFRKFKSKYPASINYNSESKEAVEAIHDWQDRILETVVPAGIKALKGIDISMFVDKEGRVFTAEFTMWDDVFQKLTALPQNTLKDLYHRLIKEQCKAMQAVEFQSLDRDDEFDYNLSRAVCGSFGIGTEYVTIDLRWRTYDVYGTFNLLKLSAEERKRMLQEASAKEKK